MRPENNSTDTIFTASNYIYWFLMLTFYFLLTNILFLINISLFKWDFFYIIFYLLSLIPTGPALSALFYCFNKMGKEKELKPAKDFFQGYRKNFKDACKLWIPSLFIMAILFVDYQYYFDKETTLSNILSYVFLFLIIVFVLLLLYAVQINTFFVIRIRDTFRLAAYYVVISLKETLGNLGIVIISLLIAYIMGKVFLVFFICVIFYLIYLNSRNVLEDIKMTFVKTEHEAKK